jgi:hypothetical protein
MAHRIVGEITRVGDVRWDSTTAQGGTGEGLEVQLRVMVDRGERAEELALDRIREAINRDHIHWLNFEGEDWSITTELIRELEHYAAASTYDGKIPVERDVDIQAIEYKGQAKQLVTVTFHTGHYQTQTS